MLSTGQSLLHQSSYQPMPSSSCLVQQLLSILLRHDELKAIWLDPHEQRVACAFSRSAVNDSVQLEVQTLIRPHSPEVLFRCLPGFSSNTCPACQQESEVILPPGLRLVQMPSSLIWKRKAAPPHRVFGNGPNSVGRVAAPQNQPPAPHPLKSRNGKKPWQRPSSAESLASQVGA
ncbi:MAG: hypothetical protein HC904_14235 [Blastochloris sp.]|nr:hypothetical protein [Blastochloris sp.]